MKKPIHLRLGSDLLARLRAHSESTGQTLTAVIESFCVAGLEAASQDAWSARLTAIETRLAESTNRTWTAAAESFYAAGFEAASRDAWSARLAAIETRLDRIEADYALLSSSVAALSRELGGTGLVTSCESATISTDVATDVTTDVAKDVAALSRELGGTGLVTLCESATISTDVATDVAKDVAGVSQKLRASRRGRGKSSRGFGG